jgi:hypothetical protein
VCGLALSCWNNSLCRSITCMRWGWRISSLYLTAVKFSGTCTMSVLWSFEIAAHIMTLPLLKLSTYWTQEEEKGSFRRLYTRILPSCFCSRKRDSSVNQILRQFRNVQPLNLLHQRTLSRLCNGINTAPNYGLLGLIPCCRSRLRTVCELNLRNPGIPAAVVDAATFDSVDERPGCTNLAPE